MSTTRSRSISHVNTNRDRLRCYKCSQYDHFARECPNALTDEESGSESEELDDSTWQMLSQVMGIGIEVQVRTTVGLGRDIEAIPEITSEIGHMTEVKVEIEREKK